MRSEPQPEKHYPCWTEPRRKAGFLHARKRGKSRRTLVWRLAGAYSAHTIFVWKRRGYVGKKAHCNGGACLLAFAVVVCALAAVSTNPAYAAAAVQQSSTSVVLSEGRGNIYDCLVFAAYRDGLGALCVDEPGRTSYHTLFEAIPAELRTQFYASIQRGSPFLMPVTGAAAARAQYTFEKPVRVPAYAHRPAPHWISRSVRPRCFRCGTCF